MPEHCGISAQWDRAGGKARQFEHVRCDVDVLLRGQTGGSILRHRRGNEIVEIGEPAVLPPSGEGSSCPLRDSVAARAHSPVHLSARARLCTRKLRVGHAVARKGDLLCIRVAHVRRLGDGKSRRIRVRLASVAHAGGHRKDQRERQSTVRQCACDDHSPVH